MMAAKEKTALPGSKPLRLFFGAFPYAAKSVHHHLSMFIEVIEPGVDKIYLVSGGVRQNMALPPKVIVKNLKSWRRN